MVGTNLGIGVDHTGNTGAVLVATGHQSGTSRAADIAAGVEVGEFHPLLGHAVQMRGVDFTAVAARIAVAHVIGHDDDEVRFGSLRQSQARD